MKTFLSRSRGWFFNNLIEGSSMKKTRFVFSMLVVGALLSVVNAATISYDTIWGQVVDSLSGSGIYAVQIISTPSCTTYSDGSGNFALGIPVQKPTGLQPFFMEKAGWQYQEKIYSLKGSLLTEKNLSSGVYLKVVSYNGQKKFCKVTNSEPGQINDQVKAEKSRALAKTKQVLYKINFQKTGYFPDSTTATGGQKGVKVKMLAITCPGTDFIGDPSKTPTIQFVGIQSNAGYINGTAYNVNAKTNKVVMWALTNQWYIQPYIAWPYTSICGDGTWKNTTNPWSSIVALVVDSAKYYTGSIRITHPALDSGVLAWAEYPPTRSDIPINWCGYQWGVKEAANPFDPGPNFWSASVNNIWVDSLGLHLKTVLANGNWTCPEVYLTKSLGHGIYTYKIVSRVDSLDSNTVFSGFIYQDPSNELDIEFSKALIGSGNNEQFVVQPYTTAGNMVRFKMPAAVHSTHQIEWQSDRVVFKSWRGWGDTASSDSIINSLIYTGVNIPAAINQELFHFNSWLVGGKAPVSGKGDEIIVKSFGYSKRAEYKLTITKANGTVTQFPNQISYDSSSVVTLTATPLTGYRFVGWSGDLTSSANPATITMNAVKNVTANFIAIPTYKISVLGASGSGAVTFSPLNNASYDSNTVVTLTATPATGFKFVSWGGDLVGSANPATITMNAAKNITVAFSATSYALTINAGGGTVTRSPNLNSLDSGAVDTLTVVPYNRFRFTGWSGDLSGSANPAIIIMNTPKNVTANFVTIPIYSLAIVSTNGTIVRSPALDAYDSNTVVTLTAKPAIGYHFTGWTGDLSGSINPTTITMNGQKSLTPIFTRNTYSLTVNAVNGAVAKVPDQILYDTNTAVTLTATPALGFIFTGWSGDLTGSTNPATITMNAAKNITANFAVIPLYALTVSAVNGAVVKSPDQASYDSSSVVNLAANPIAGYQFTGWSGDLTGSVNPVNVTMNAVKNITANFKKFVVGDTTLPKLITFTSMPLIGFGGNLFGTVNNLAPIDYGIVVYINVGGSWWVKPYWAAKVTPINNDGTWSCNVVTGGNDAYASEYRAFVIPAGYTPPDDIGSLPAEDIFATQDTIRAQ
jgi:uncharacterized repeat protein (TIGR02543 family)